MCIVDKDKWNITLQINKKKNFPSCSFCRSHGQLCENNRKRKDWQILGPCKWTKKKNQWNMRVTVIPFVFGALGTVSNCLENRGRYGNQKENWDHPLLRSARIL